MRLKTLKLGLRSCDNGPWWDQMARDSVQEMHQNMHRSMHGNMHRIHAPAKNAHMHAHAQISRPLLVGALGNCASWEPQVQVRGAGVAPSEKLVCYIAVVDIELITLIKYCL